MSDSIPLKQCSRKDKCINPLGSWLPATTEYFRKASKEKSGLTSRCKACLHVGDAAYREQNPEHGKQWYEDNKERLSADFKEEYWSDPDKYRNIQRIKYEKNPEPFKARARRYQIDNPDKVRSIKRDIYLRKRLDPEWWTSELKRVAQYYLDHPEKKREHTRKVNESRTEYKREHARKQYIMFPEKSRAKSHKRMAMKKAVGGSYTQDDLKRLYEEQEGRCAYCGISIYWSIPRDIHIDHIKPLSKGGSNNPDNLNLTCHSCNESKADKELSGWLLTRGW